jgi:hypothetical protein
MALTWIGLLEVQKNAQIEANTTFVNLKKANLFVLLKKQSNK